MQHHCIGLRYHRSASPSRNPPARIDSLDPDGTEPLSAVPGGNNECDERERNGDKYECKNHDFLDVFFGSTTVDDLIEDGLQCSVVYHPKILLFSLPRRAFRSLSATK
jgi:hypothetical protein